jgi:UDP-glucose 4-epimerase
MKVLITGGAGFIGRHLTAALLRQAADVTVFDNLHRSAPTNVCNGATFKLADIRDRSAVASAMEGVEVVYHLAAQSNVLGSAADPDYSFSTNVVGTYNVLTCAHEQGVRRMVFTSSREVYGEAIALPVSETAPLNPHNIYGASKAAGELYCSAFVSEGLDVTILRLANVYGPDDSDRVIPLFIDRALSCKPLVIYGNGKILDFVWIGDVVQALVASASARVSGRIINIGSGQGVTLPELASRILKSAGSSSAIQQLPARGMEVNRFVADISLARGLLRYSPSARPLQHLETVIDTVRSQRPESCPTQGSAGLN